MPVDICCFWELIRLSRVILSILLFLLLPTALQQRSEEENQLWQTVLIHCFCQDLILPRIQFCLSLFRHKMISCFSSALFLGKILILSILHDVIVWQMPAEKLKFQKVCVNSREFHSVKKEPISKDCMLFHFFYIAF